MPNQEMTQKSTFFFSPLITVFQRVLSFIGLSDASSKEGLTLWIHWDPFSSASHFGTIVHSLESRLARNQTLSQNVENCLPSAEPESELDSRMPDLSPCFSSYKNYLLERDERMEWLASLPETPKHRCDDVVMLDAISLGKERFWSVLSHLPKAQETRNVALHLLSIEAADRSPERVAKNLCRLTNRWQGLLILDLNGPDMTFRFRRRLLGSLARFRMLSLRKFNELELEGAFAPPILTF